MLSLDVSFYFVQRSHTEIYFWQVMKSMLGPGPGSAFRDPTVSCALSPPVLAPAASCARPAFGVSRTRRAARGQHWWGQRAGRRGLECGLAPF